MFALLLLSLIIPSMAFATCPANEGDVTFWTDPWGNWVPSLNSFKIAVEPGFYGDFDAYEYAQFDGRLKLWRKATANGSWYIDKIVSPTVEGTNPDGCDVGYHDVHYYYFDASMENTTVWFGVSFLNESSPSVVATKVLGDAE